jgi:hypothetical protein
VFFSGSTSDLVLCGIESTFKFENLNKLSSRRNKYVS